MVHPPPSPEAPGSHNSVLTEQHWRILLAGISGAVLLFTIYCLASGITTIFMHLYYFPIILLAYHYQRTGVLLSALLGALYVAIVAFFTYPTMQLIAGAIVRFWVFVGISMVVAYLSFVLARQQISRQTLFDRAGGGILYVSRQDLTITDANPHFLNLLGYGRDELTGTSLGNICTTPNGEVLTPETFAPTMPEEYRKVLIKAKDGHEKSAIISVGELPDDQYVLIITDITGQIQLQNENRQLSVLQENIIANASVWLMVLSAKGKVLIWNKAAEDISGYPAEEVIGNAGIWKQLYPDRDYRQSVTEEIDDIIQTDNYLRNFETTILSKNGEKKNIMWNTRALSVATAAGEEGFVAIGVDITSRVNNQIALKKSELEFKALFNQTFQQIGLLDPEGTILKVNQRALDFAGLSKPEVIGKKIWDSPWWSHSAKAQIQMQEIIRKAALGENIQTETTNQGADGSIHYIDFSLNPVKDETGRVVFLISEGWDITELKETEEALRESEIKFRGVAERSSVIIMLTDSEGTIIYVSPSTEKILGYTPEELTSPSSEKYLSPDNLRLLKDSIQKNMSGEETDGLILSGNRKDGRPVIIEFSGTPIKENGRISGVQLLGRDITQETLDHARIEELVSQQKEQLDIINKSPAVAFLWRAEEDWPVEMVSENVIQFGYTPEELLSGKILFSAMVHPEDLAWVGEEVEYNSENHNDTFRQIYRIIGKDQQVYWIEDFTEIRRNPAGEITHYQGIIHNITERKVAEDALKREKTIIESIMESLPGMFYMFHMVDSTAKFVRWNHNMETLTGYSRSEIAEMGPLDLIADEYTESIRGIMEESFSRGSGDVESIVITKDGKAIPFYFSATMKKIEGEPYLIGLALDITKSKKVEDALKTVNKKLNLLSSITRHDIINQVTAAQMFVDVIEMEGEVPPDSKTAEDLKTIGGALKTIERQIVFTRDYQDLGMNAPDWYGVDEIVERVASGQSELLKVDNEVKNLEIYADPLFEKVIYNLYDNAVRHGEKITTIRFRSEETPQGLKLICEDDGVGVPADVKEKIFNRQYFKHTGLGLFLSKEILSITGMSITETGVPGEGARFEILVPEGMWQFR